MKLRVDHLTTGHVRGTPVLDRVSFSVPSGRRLAVIGPSGAGKSTLLLTLAGFQEPWSGTVEFDDAVVSKPGSSTPPGDRHIGMVFQDHGLWPHRTVAGHLAFVLAAGRISGRERAERIHATLERVGLARLSDRKPATLSGGEAQRLALARAIVARPQLLLLDEPLGALDSELHREMLALIDEVAAETTVLIVTHDVHEAVALADELIVLADGRIQQQGEYHQLYHHSANSVVARLCGECALLSCAADGTTRVGRVDPPGKSGRIVIRPEQLRRSDDGAFEARVVRCIPDGGRWTMTLDFEEDQIDVPGPEHVGRGEILRFDLEGEPHFIAR